MGADGRRRDAVLAGAGLGDDPLLAETPGNRRLAERVVDLVRAGVQQILPFQVDALVRGEAACAGERRRAPRVAGEQRVELGPEARVVAQRRPRGGQLVERRDERLRDVPAAVLAVVAVVHRAASTHARTFA